MRRPRSVRILGRSIGVGEPTYVIAEIGVNHDGDPERAIQLVDAAASAGADAIKLQVFRAELLLSKASRLASYQRDAGERDPVDMLSRLELADDAMRTCVARSHERGVAAIASVFSVELVMGAADIGFDAFKSASPDIVNRPLLDAMVETDRPLIVSTGTATLDEVRRADTWLRDRSHVTFLHCVSAYPTPIAAASIGAMSELQSALPSRLIGYSDHTTDVITGAVAAAAGAQVIEKHLSHDRSAIGPDHASSLDPDQFGRYVKHIRTSDALMGRSVKSPQTIEGDVKRLSRQSVVTTRALVPGQVVSRDDLTIKRPGTGIEPWRINEVVGAPVVRSVDADVPITEADVELSRAGSVEWES